MITSFQGNYRFLSNFYPCLIQDKEGNTYASTEHAYQAAKFTTNEGRLPFTTTRNLTAEGAKRLGRHIPLRRDWEQIKIPIMRRLLELKFAEGSDLARQLLATREEELVEGNHWNDRFWGQCPLGTGKNWLGRLLMERRQQLKEIPS